MIFKSTKTYGHELGLSCVFRQPKATSHCNLLHGYALSFKFTFSANGLDERNWVMDFGGLAPVKEFLKNHFDHTLVVSKDDDKLEIIKGLEKDALAKVVVLPAVGCEAISKFVYESVFNFILEATAGRVWIESVEVREHGANSAIFAPTPAIINKLIKAWVDSKTPKEDDAQLELPLEDSVEIKKPSPKPRKKNKND